MDRYRVITNLAEQNNWKHGLELGVWVGVTTFWLMKHTSVNMTCVDAWEGQDDNPEYHDANEQRFRKEAEQWGDRIKIIKGRSLDIIDEIPDNSMDFIFHDSDHSYPFVKNEIEAYLPKLKQGGYCMGDDYNWTPVKQSVQEAFGNNHRVTGKDVWYSIKN